MTRFQRGAWSLAVLVTLVAAAWALPMAAKAGPQEQLLTEQAELRTQFATATVPAGWSVDIASAANERIRIANGDVRVSVRDVVWFGDTSELLQAVAEAAFPEGANVPVVTQEPEPGTVGSWRIDAASVADTGGSEGGATNSGTAAWAQVIRLGDSAVVVQVAGPADARQALADDIDGIVASVALDDALATDLTGERP